MHDNHDVSHIYYYYMANLYGSIILRNNNYYDMQWNDATFPYFETPPTILQHFFLLW